MTADQFQREVLDILELVGVSNDDKMFEAAILTCKARKATDPKDILVYQVAAMAVRASIIGYSLDTIFQMTLDELEKNNAT